MPDARIIALRPIEFEVSTDAAIDELTRAMMSPVFALAEDLQARFQAEGLPSFRKVRVTVAVSPALRAVLNASDAFTLTIEHDNA